MDPIFPKHYTSCGKSLKGRGTGRETFLTKSFHIIGRVQHHHKLFDHIQHILVTPDSWAAIQIQLIGWLLETEPPLRSIIIVEPWPPPDARETYDENLDWIGVTDNWHPTFAESPTELDFSTLTSALVIIDWRMVSPQMST